MTRENRETFHAHNDQGMKHQISELKILIIQVGLLFLSIYIMLLVGEADFDELQHNDCLRGDHCQ